MKKLQNNIQSIILNNYICMSMCVRVCTHITYEKNKLREKWLHFIHTIMHSVVPHLSVVSLSTKWSKYIKQKIPEINNSKVLNYVSFWVARWNLPPPHTILLHPTWKVKSPVCPEHTLYTLPTQSSLSGNLSYQVDCHSTEVLVFR